MDKCWPEVPSPQCQEISVGLMVFSPQCQGISVGLRFSALSVKE
jgi:hypothetical protein